MSKQVKIDTINAVKSATTKTFKEKASEAALKGYVIATVLAVYGGAMVYFGIQWQAAHTGAQADTIQVVKIPTATAATPGK